MSCVEHPDREGTAACDTCGALMCDRCITHSAERWPGSCAACKRKQRAARPAPPVEPPKPPWPRGPLFILGVVSLVLSSAFPAGIIVDAARERLPAGPESPASMGAGLAIAFAILIGVCGLMWNLVGLVVFAFRSRFARLFFTPYYALLVAPLVLEALDRRVPPLFVALAIYGVLMLTWLFGSRDVKAALFR